LFVTSPRIGGIGITLTAASAVLIAEFDFTSAIMLQSEDRVHRLGQTRHVTVKYLYANKTVDGFMLALINRKQQIFDAACDGLADPQRRGRKLKKLGGNPRQPRLLKRLGKNPRQASFPQTRPSVKKLWTATSIAVPLRSTAKADALCT